MVEDDTCGAIQMFIGRPRADKFSEKDKLSPTVIHINYTYHKSLFTQVSRDVQIDIPRMFPKVKSFVVVHRIGQVNVGEISLLVIVATPHRKEALVAIDWIVDDLKSRLPVWKEERYSDGSSSYEKRNKEIKE
ncbi:hypothetical protein SNEBB_000221 [Seison nebaliae]|nr:hypothetical protein SNEBB_000221 [Seison nebaliae]